MLALIALGGNAPHLGMTPQGVQIAAMADLEAAGFVIKNRSKFYRTAAFPLGSGPDYVNSALQLDVGQGMTAAQVLARMAAIELSYGRTRSQRWGGRTLDLDLLALEDQILPDIAGFRAWADLDTVAAAQVAPSDLILPHPRLHERAFVLVPLLDIAPDWRHPIFGKTVRQMHDALAPADRAGVVALMP
ncbi:MAG: 2-amino-4-hydroxy-6-hydroxymethyldihydropteridine diphosphokinase [Cypionkella sp.]|nr:2-amino-4-hydroxy-6-hydroxymethyldihydropteridine diphosphokinase [Cypionkella sp.]